MTYELDTLPAYGVLRVYVTADRVSPESASEGMPAESGWTSAVGERTLYDARNYVTPVFEARVPLSDDDRNELTRVVGTLGAYGTDDGSTLYGEDAHENYETGDWYNYCLHAHVKHYDSARGYVEDDVSIVEG